MAEGRARRFLITGGAGFLGINLVRFLLEKGEEAASLDVAEFDYPDVRDRVEVIRGDIRDKACVDRAVKGSDVVVHAAAALPLYSKKDILTTDVDGTRNVLDAAWKHGVKRVVHISSTAVYGIPDHHPIREDDELKGVGTYGRAKIEAEKICEEFRAKGMCVTILRPKSFVGPERLGVFAIFYEWASEGRSFPLLNGKNRYQLLDVADLCEAVYLAANAPRDKANDTFNIGAREFGTMAEDYQAVLDRAGFGKKIKTFPAAPVIWILRILELFRLSPLYRWVYETMPRDSYVSIEKAEKVLGFSPRYSNREALVRNYEWYLANKERLRNVSGVSHRVPWKQGVLKLVKLFF